MQSKQLYMGSKIILKGGLEKVERERERERNKEIERESDHYVLEDCVSKEPSLLGLPEEEPK